MRKGIGTAGLFGVRVKSGIKVLVWSAGAILPVFTALALALSSTSALTAETLSNTQGPVAGGQHLTINGTDMKVGRLAMSQISAGTYHTCGIYNGAAYCWGLGASGQLGNGTLVNSSIPSAVDVSGVLSGKTITAISAGNNFTVALADDGKAYAWGANNYGQLGDNLTATTRSAVPVAVDMSGVLNGKTITALSAGEAHVLAVADDGKAYAWGYNAYGRLGDGTALQRNTPTAVDTTGVLNGKIVTAVAAGESHSLALTTDGKIYAWGSNSAGRLGDGTTTQRLTPVAVDDTGVLAGKVVTKISAGLSHSAALTSDGVAYSWGQPGNIGDGVGVYAYVPVPVDASGVLAGRTITAIDVGVNHTVVATADGKVFTWGANTKGQLGDGTVTQRTTPVAVTVDAVLSGKKVTAVSAGSEHTTALADDGQVYAWGYNIYGKLGDGTATQRTTPVAVSTTGDIQGKSVFGGNEVPAVTIDGAPVKVTSVAPGGTSLTVRTEPHIAGTVDSTVTSFDGLSSATIVGGYTFVNGPEMASVAPASGSIVGGDSITITGQNFSPGAKVKFGAAYASTVSVIDASTIIATAPPAFLAGAVDLTVEDTYGQTSTLARGFTYDAPQPVVSSITPLKGPEVGNQQVVVGGDGMQVGRQAMLQVSGGDYHSCGIYDGTSFCWGYSSANGTKGTHIYTPGEVGIARSTESAPYGVLKGKTITAISSGANHTLALAADGTVYAWGLNGSGQLGDGTTTHRKMPVAVNMTGELAGKTVRAVIAGGDSSFALTSDGKVYAWGENAHGQLGNNSTADKSTPVAINIPGEVVTQISAGMYHVVAMTASGQPYAWGSNQYGQYGDGGVVSSTVPIAVNLAGALAGKSVTAIIAGGYYFTAAIADDGKLYTWGYNGQGQLGNDTTTDSLLPTPVDTSGPLAGKRVVAAAAGTYHLLALSSEGKVYAWGYNAYGALGNGGTARSLVPVAVDMSGALAGKTVTAIGAGSYHSLALTSEGQLFTWGRNTYGALGDGTSTSQVTPVAVDTTGEVLNKLMYGTNDYPSVQLGGSAVRILSGALEGTRLVGTTSAHAPGSVDVSVSAYDGRTTPSVLTNGYEFMAAPKIVSLSPASGSITGGDIVTVTGHNFREGARVLLGREYSELVTVHSSTSLSFTVPARDIGGFVDVVVEDEYGQRVTLARGFEYIEQSPIMTGLSISSGPSKGTQQVTITGENFVAGVSPVEQIDSAGNHTCGVYERLAYCWGRNSNGVLGDGTTTDRIVPVAVDTSGVLAGKTITAVSVGGTHSLALTSEGKVYAWGYNYYGSLGNGETASSLVPVAVDTSGALAGKTVTAISAGYNFSLALTSDGKVYGWGYNAYGQLGDTTTASRITPVAVDTSGALAGKTVTAISTGTDFSLALTSEGEVFSWGSNANGRLGDGTTTRSTTPIAVDTTGVLAGKDVAAIAVGNTHALVLTRDGIMAAWGSNSNGQLGDGTQTQRITPVAVNMGGAMAGKTIVEISSGGLYSLARTSDGQLYAWGYNGYGGLGNGTTTYSTTPVTVDMTGALAGKAIIAISGGEFSTFAITSEGEVYSWGYNVYGQLGDGTTTQQNYPVPVNTTSMPLGSLVYVRTVPTVTFGGVAAHTLFTAPDGSSMIVLTPAHAGGTVNVRTTNYDGQYSELANAYTFIAGPEITSVMPNSGSVAGGDTVTISGASFTAQTKVSFGGIDASSVTRIDGSTLSATVPAGVTLGTVDVVVRDDIGQQMALPQAYTYRTTEPAVVQSTSPVAGFMTGGETVTITGSGFMPKTDGGTWYKVWFGGIEATNVTYVNETTLTARVPAAAPGKVEVMVGGDYVEPGTLQGGYQYLARYYIFSNPALNIETNTPGKMTITAQDASRLPVTSTHDTVITLTSTSATGAFAVDLNEAEATRWGHTQVVLPAGQSSVDVWYKDSVTVNATIKGDVYGVTSFSQLARVGTPYRLQVSGLTNPIKAGVPSSITVRVVDTNGNSRPDYTGTLTFSSADAAAKVPGNYTMQASDYGIKTFTNGVTFGTQGAQCVKVADSLDPVITGQACATVEAPSSGVITQLVITTPEQRVAAGKQSSVITIQAQDTAGEAIPVTADTPVYLYSNSSTGEFSFDGQTWQGLGAMPVEMAMTAGTSSLNVRYRDSTAATFTLSARDLTTDTSNSGGAGDQGWTNAMQYITTGVSPPTRLVLAGPDTLVSNTQGTYRIELQDDVGNVVTADAGVAVRIDGSTTTSRFFLPADPAVAVAGPVEFMIPEGATGVELGILDTTLSAGANYTRITATDARPETEVVRLSDALFDVQIVSSLAASVSITSTETSVIANTPAPVTITVKNETGDTAYVSQATEVAVSASPAGEFSLTASPFTPISSVSFARGELGQKTLYYRSTMAGTMTLSAASTGLSGGSTSLEVTADALARYDVTPSAVGVARGTTSDAFTVTGYDIYGNVVTQATNHTVYLYSSSASTEFSDTTATAWGAASAVILAGDSTAQFVMRDSAFSDAPVQLTVSDSTTLDNPDTGIANGTARVTITSEVVSALQVSSPTRTIAAGEVSGAVTVQLQKADGTPAYQDGSTFVDAVISQGAFLASTNPENVVVRLAVPRGQAEVSFYYTGTVAGVHTAEFLAGAVKTTQNITVNAGLVAGAAFTTPAQTIQAGDPSASFVVAFYDTYNNPASLGADTHVSLASSCATGTFSESATTWQPTNSITARAGASDVTFYYSDTRTGDCTITVNVAGLSAITQPVVVEGGDLPATISIESAIAQPLVKGSNIRVVVTLRSVDGSIVPAVSPTTVYLSTTSADGLFTTDSIVFQPGESTRTISYYEPAVGTVTLAARDQTGTIEDPASLADGSLAVEYIEGTNPTGGPVRISIESAATQPQAQGSVIAATVSLRDDSGTVVAAVSPTTVYLSTTSADGAFTPSVLTFQPGQSVHNVSYFEPAVGTVTLTAHDQAGAVDEPSTMTDGTLTVEYAQNTGGPVAGVALSVASTTKVGQVYPVTISLVDASGAPTNADGEGRTVTLGSSNEGGAFSLTSDGAQSGSLTITIPAGQSTTLVYYSQVEAGLVTLYGASSGIVTGEVTITMQAGAVATIGFMNAPYTDARTLDINEPGIYTVSLYDEFGNVVSATEALTLYVTSSQSGELSASEVVIEPGQSSGTFTYKQATAGLYTMTVDAASPSSIETITQDGAVAAVKPQSFRFVHDAISLERGAVSQPITIELLDANGQLITAKGAGQTIRLSMQSGAGQFAKSVNGIYYNSMYITVPAGSSAVSFFYRNDAGNPSDTQVILGDSTFAGKEVHDTLPVTLTYGEAVSLRFVTPQQTMQATHPSQVMTVEQRNRYGKPVPAAQDTVLHLRSTAGETADFGRSKVDWGVNRVVLPAGAASASFYYKDSAVGTPTITVADTLPLSPDIQMANARQSVTITEQVIPREVDNFLVTNISDPQDAGTLSSVVVVARDIEGYVVESYTGTIRFASTALDATVPTREYRMYSWIHKGVLTVSNAVSFSEPGEKSVSVTDVDTGTTGSQDAIMVLSANTNPVSSVVFSDTQSPIRLAPNETSSYIAVQLLDANGAPTTAPLEGFDVRLTRSSTGGLLSSSISGPWQSELVVTVPAGASFAYVYYKDSVSGTSTLSASDWVGATDDSAVANDTLAIDVQAVYLEGSQSVESLNALGVYEKSAYLFAHNNDGGIIGHVQAAFNTYDMIDDTAADALWRTQWRQGVTLLQSGAPTGVRQDTSFNVNDIVAKAGDNDFYAVAEATQASFDDLFSVASNQQAIRVSPWRSVLTVDSSRVATEGTLTAQTMFYNGDVSDQPTTAILYLLPSDATSTSAALQVWDVAEIAPSAAMLTASLYQPQGGTDATPGITVSTAGLDQQAMYRMLVVTYDVDGNITSQSASPAFGLLGQVEIPSTDDGDAGQTILPPGVVRPNVTPTAPVDDDDVATGPSHPGTAQPQPLPKINDAAAEGELSATHISGYVAATTVVTSVVVIALLREAYKEVSRVVRLRRLLRRENQLVQDKQTFLSLGAHYLRTPIAILDAAGSMVGPGAGAVLAPIIQSLKEKSEQLLGNQETAELADIDNPEIKRASRSALLSVFFWLPVVLSILLTIAINQLLATAQDGTAGNPVVVYAVIIGIAVALAVFFVARTIIINRERERLTRALDRRRAALFNAKSQFIDNVKNGLSSDVRHLSELKNTLTINQNPALVGPITESIEKLNSLTGKLALASHMNGVPIDLTDVAIDTLVAGAVNAQVDQISKKQLRVHKKISGRSGVKQDARLLNFVIASVIDNAVKFAPQKTNLEVTARSFGGRMQVQVENATSGAGDASVVERMFEPFNHATTPSDLTADGMGMSLYLNKLIMGHLGGSIEARRNTFKNTIEVVVRVNTPAAV